LIRGSLNQLFMIIIVMGVSGSGKSTIGERLANALHWTFVDADTFHPPANIDKMSRGIPLIDTDRLPWLLRLRKLIDGWLDEGRNVVLACSALKLAYREILMGNTTQTRLVYLKGAMTLFEERMVRRQHFMPKELLQSQMDSLEEPVDAITINAAEPPDRMIEQIMARLTL
jgi:gluconokinase